MFICFLWFCHGLPKGEIVRTYVIHLLGTYVTILCNWLIFWQNALYLYLDRFRICLILQETCCSSLVLKPWRLDQETSEEKLFTKVGQIARHLRIDSLTYSYLSRFNEAQQILSIEVSIKNYGIQIFISDFRPMLMYLCRVSFLTTLEIYKAYLRSCHIREYKKNICKRWPMPYSLRRKLLHFCALGFCNQVLLDLHCRWSEKLCSQHLL